MKMRIKPWLRSPFFSTRFFLIAIIIITLLETIDVLTTEDRKLVFKVALKDKDPQTDLLQQNASIVHDYRLHLDSPGWFYSLVLENNIGISPLFSILSLIICVCGLIIVLKVDPNDLFKNDVSRIFFVAAIAVLIYYFIERYTYRSFRSTVLEITHQEYKLRQLEHTWLLGTGIALAWLGRMMKRGYQLQREQALTI